MTTKDEALKLALPERRIVTSAGNPEDYINSGWNECLDAINEALADSALERMAKNERELGIDYMRPAEIPQSITCPFCESQHVPGWLHDYNMDRGAYGEQPAQQERCHLCDCTGDIHSPDGEWRGECPYCKQPAQREHITDGSRCWCDPELDYKDPDTGVEVWIHKEPQ